MQVVYRGKPQRAPGPDFRGALLLLDGDLRHGDVEVHVRSSDWWTHRHDRDHRYDGVILHVVYQEDPERPVRTARGAEVPCLVLEGRVAGPERSADQPGLGEDDCRRRLAALSDADLGARLDQLGDRRLLDRAAALEADLTTAEPEQVLYERLMEVLGYSQNRWPCLELARRLPVARLYALAHRRPPGERAALCQGLLFGVAGLLPSQRPLATPLDWASAEAADELERTWAAFGGEWESEVVGAGAWSFGVRPLNSPARRLAGMSHFLAAHLESDLYQTMARELRSPGGAVAVRQLVDLLRVEAPESYWAGYFDFGRPVGARTASLVGPERAREAVVNVCLPLALACSLSSGDTLTAEAAWSAYLAAPRLAPNEVTRWMMAEVLGRGRARLVDSARRQQGLHHLYRTACDQRRCDDCPLLGTQDRPSRKARKVVE